MVGMLFSIPVAKMKLAMEPSVGLRGATANVRAAAVPAL
jgi:hypothetical protein